MTMLFNSCAARWLGRSTNSLSERKPSGASPRTTRGRPGERPEPFAQEIQRHLRGAPIKLGISNLPVAIDDRHPAGVPGKQFVEGLPQRAIFPITLGAVARGEFGRETNDAVKHGAPQNGEY